MKIFHFALLSVLLASATTSRASLIYYGGDIDQDQYILCQSGGISGEFQVFENFVWTSSSPAREMFGTFTMSAPFPLAVWEIRSGMSAGNAGTLVARNIAETTAIDIGGGTSTGANYRVTVALPNVNLVEGQTYFMALAPVVTDPNNDSSGIGATLGIGGVGSTVGDNIAFLVSPNHNYVPLSSLMSNPNVSLGIESVPEPSFLATLGIVALAARRRRR